MTPPSPRSDTSTRGQSEVVGAVLVFGLVVITVSGVGLLLVTSQQQQAESAQPSIDVRGDVGGSWATVSHTGGAEIPLADLVLVLNGDGSETRYDLDGAGVTLSDDDGDDVFDAGETANVSNPYGTDVRLRLLKTSEPTRTLYDETFGTAGGGGGGGGGGGADASPSITRFDVNDTSSGGNASYDVAWRATDDEGDISGATLELVDQETGTVVDSESYTFGGVGDTGTRVGNLTNASGGGEVYIVELRVTDAAGNTAKENIVDTADSNIGLRDPVIQSFTVTDTTSGNTVSYDATYNATDADGDLVEVQVELVNATSGVRVDNVTKTYNQVEVTGETTVSLSGPKSLKDETVFVNVTATDLNDGTDSANVTDVADGTGGGGAGAKAPTIAEFFYIDQSTCGNTVQYELDWNVTDDQGDLDTVVVELLEGGKVEASQSYSVSGSQANGTTTLAPSKNLCGSEVTLRINATDAAGNSGTDSVTDTADGSGGNDPALPVIQQFDATDNSDCGNNNVRYDVTWNVTDAQDDLDTVVVELLEDKQNNPKTLDSESYAVSGGQADDVTLLTVTGNDGKKTCGSSVVVRITVTDAAGNSAESSWTDTADGSGSN